ncbi:hypothetical protein QAA20_004725 [Salmonella enterica]|nr:hypothetical protein [Salmonella enterica]EDU8324138.1 hypothetical protein [Salmonella enterica subsp. diarizonae]EEF7552397.1 hypothetical protein [Salmonella enterica subsp. diarizonae serovar 48:i:z]EIC4423078.1 hypothetical protein [Salmonella enterica subsp. enterica serovar Cerro]EIE5051763.1 hypothetical protein [Salmonella enterica subsp. enterica serovar Java]ESG61335.1 hypothetical protein SEEM1594_21326 [Salmonella enterica subsp. enterica serovar Muenchen str. baa1594]
MLSKSLFVVSVKWFTEFGHLNRGDMLTLRILAKMNGDSPAFFKVVVA